MSVLIGLLGLAFSAHAQSVRERCSNKWGTDYRMVVWCMKQQNAAYRKLDPDYGWPERVRPTEVITNIPRADTSDTNPDLDEMRRQNGLR